MRSLAVKVPKGIGESTRKRLIELGLLDKGLLVLRGDDHLLFPVTAPPTAAEDLELVEDDFEVRELQETDYRQVVALPPALSSLLPTSFDVIGDVAIIKLEEELLPYAQEVGKGLRATFPRLRLVALDRGVKGEYRVRDLQVIAGEGTMETQHQEHGLRLLVDPARMYFNPRLANERRRIASLVRPGETVVDMFAGVGPFALMIAKYAQPAVVYAIDINPDAVHYLKQNILANKVERVVPLEGDSRQMIFELPCSDRVIMNLPHSALDFYADALTRLKLGGTMHLYHLCDRSDIQGVQERLVQDALGMGVKVNIVRCQELKTYSPSASVFALDLAFGDWA